MFDQSASSRAASAMKDERVMQVLPYICFKGRKQRKTPAALSRLNVIITVLWRRHRGETGGWKSLHSITQKTLEQREQSWIQERKEFAFFPEKIRHPTASFQPRKVAPWRPTVICYSRSRSLKCSCKENLYNADAFIWGPDHICASIKLR